MCIIILLTIVLMAEIKFSRVQLLAAYLAGVSLMTGVVLALQVVLGRVAVTHPPRTNLEKIIFFFVGNI